MNKINKNYINGYINKYFHWIMNTISDTKYDVVLLISGQSLSFSETMIKELRASQTSARFILYQWDSQKNFPYIVKMHKFFDVRYSFDKVDTEQDGDIEIEQPPSGIKERLGIKGAINKEESHEEERCSKEIPHLHRQPPEYVRNLFHIGTKIQFVVFHPKYSILIPETSNLSHFLIPHTTCFHDRKAESNFAPEKLMET